MKHLLIFIAVFTLVACSEKDQKAPQRQQAPKPVRVTEAREKELIFYDRFPATVVALDEVEVRPQISGYITRKHFKEGDYVKRGQRLFTVDVRRYVADVDQAQANVEAAKARLELAEKNVARYRRLAEAEAVAVQTMEQAEAQLKADRQSVAAAEAAVTSASTQLDYASIRAPMSGLTSLRSVKVGTQVSPGNPVLTIISKKEPIGVDFALPQDAIPRLASIEAKLMASNSEEPATITEGKVAMVDSTFRLLLPDGSVFKNYGSIYASGRAVDPRTGTLNVRLEYKNDDNILRSGMSLEVEMLNRQSGKQLVIPRQALGEQMGEYYVFVEKDSIVRRQKVTTGAKIREDIIVTGGLEAGQMVVSEGLKGLRDSAKVKLIPSANRGGKQQGQKESSPATKGE